MDKLPELDELGVLHTVNEVLNTKYKRLEDIPDDKLRRVYMLLRIEQILTDHPDFRVFMCNPSHVPPAPKANLTNIAPGNKSHRRR